MYTNVLNLLACATTALAASQGFNYGAVNSDGSNRNQADFQKEFALAKSLPGTNGGFTSARLYTMIVRAVVFLILTKHLLTVLLARRKLNERTYFCHSSCYCWRHHPPPRSLGLWRWWLLLCRDHCSQYRYYNIRFSLYRFGCWYFCWKRGSIQSQPNWYCCQFWLRCFTRDTCTICWSTPTSNCRWTFGW